MQHTSAVLLPCVPLLLASCVTVRISAPRAPVYECAAEDGSGRVVRVEYSGDPVKLSEGIADEPGGLWSCYRAARSQPLPSARAAFLGLSLAASADHGIACRISPWAPIPAALEACE